MKLRNSLVAVALAALIALAGCKKDEPAAPPAPAEPPPMSQAPAASPPPPEPAFAVTEIQTAKLDGDDTASAQPTSTFAPSDEITVLVFTSGTGGHVLGARWTYGDDRQAVHQEDAKIDATGAGVHRFQISDPGGLPAGDYQVEIVIDDAPAGSRPFKVE